MFRCGVYDHRITGVGYNKVAAFDAIVNHRKKVRSEGIRVFPVAHFSNNDYAALLGLFRFFSFDRHDVSYSTNIRKLHIRYRQGSMVQSILRHRI